MFFHKQALLLHCCAAERGRYALNSGHLTDYGLVTTDGRRLMSVPPLQLSDFENDLSAAFRLVPLTDVQLKAWLKAVPSQTPIIRITCKDPTAADNEAILRFECMQTAEAYRRNRSRGTPPAPQPLEIKEGDGTYPDWMSVMPQDPAKDFIHVNVDADYLAEMASTLSRIAMAHKPAGTDGENPIVTLRIHRKSPLDTAMVIDGPLGMWGIVMPVGGLDGNDDKLDGAMHPKHLDELQETQSLDISALSSPLPLDYFSSNDDDDEDLDQEVDESTETEPEESDDTPVDDDADEADDEVANDEADDEYVDDEPVIEEVEVTGDKVPVLINDQPQ